MPYPRRFKYSNKPTIIDGIKFDSKKEAKRYTELNLLDKAGKISALELQPKFTLQEAFEKNGKKYKPIIYIADFQYWDKDLNKIIVEDTKGFRNRIFQMKHKMFEFKFPDLTLRLT